MEEVNPSGLRFLQDRLGTSDLADVKKAIIHALNINARRDTLLFDGRAGDAQLVATMKDVVERMARVTHRQIRWHNDKEFGTGSKSGSKSPSNQPTGSNSSRDDEDEGRKESAAFICCSRDDALKHARVLRSALEVKLGRECSIGGSVYSDQKLDLSDLMVVLLTKRMLTNPIALLEVFKAGNPAGTRIKARYNFPADLIRVSGPCDGRKHEHQDCHRCCGRGGVRL